MNRFVVLLVTLATLTVAFPGVLGQSNAPVGPIANGDFETGTIPEPVADVVAGTPGADTCIGAGHQVFWGDDSPQHVLFGDEQDPQPQPDGPQTLAESYADGERDPAEDAQEQSGVDHCVFNEQDGKAAVWLTPQGRTRAAAGWSTALGPDSATSFAFVADADRFDREAIIHPDSSKNDHNLWQVQDQQKGFTENFQTMTFAIENEAPIPGPAHIEVGFSLSPGYAQHPFVGAFWEGAVKFDASDMQPDADGIVELDPVEDGRIVCPGGYTPCQDYKADYEGAQEEPAKRDLLGQTRIVQVSFWAFNHGDGPVVIDDVAIEGATTAAEEIAEANVNVNPLPEE